MIKPILLSIVFSLLIPLTVFSKTITQHDHKLNNDWKFLKSDVGGIWEIIRTPSIGQPTNLPIWENVSLPHCFNATDAVDSDVNYYQGPGWYRKLLTIDNPYPNGHVLLHFEGSGQKTEVYVGFNKVGSHVGGYDEWTLDITDYIKQAQENSFIKKTYHGLIPVSVRCDNSRDLEMIPSDLSDFHIYGGLYRMVHLKYVPENWLNNLKIEASVDNKGKNGLVSFNLTSAKQWSDNSEVNIKIFSPAGLELYGETVEKGKLNANWEIKSPILWSPRKPSLYSVRVEATINGQKQILTDSFGFRFFEFKKHGPFFLNGTRLLLKGTHRHEDFAGAGAAASQKKIRNEMLLIKEMGANFIRLGHYQQSQQVLNLCDSLGILVWEEIPWCRGGLGGEHYRTQAKNMLTHMIEQHYNHPSIILWGLGNENDWPGDFQNFKKDSIRAFMSSLNDLSHQLDPNRKTTIRRCDFCKDIIDVYSPSIWAGWYRGRYSDYKKVSENEMKKVDHFFHAEWGADSHAGRHSEDVSQQWKTIASGNEADERAGDASLYGGPKRMSKDGDWSESYAVELYDWTLKEQLDMPWLTGSAFWVFKDFATPIRPENPIPYVNQKGVVQRDLTPKEVYYVVQSYWSDKPMVHIYGHSWPVRWGKKGQSSLAKVYSNCDKVELFVNGKSQGVKRRKPGIFPAAGLFWNINLHGKINNITALGYNKGKTYKDTLTWAYQTGEWKDVKTLKIWEETIDANTSLIHVKALDENGLVCLDSKLPVEFQVAGEAELLQNQGTVTGSRKIQLANGQAQIILNKQGSHYSVAVKSATVGCFILETK